MVFVLSITIAGQKDIGKRAAFAADSFLKSVLLDCESAIMNTDQEKTHEDEKGRTDYEKEFEIRFIDGGADFSDRAQCERDGDVHAKKQCNGE